MVRIYISVHQYLKSIPRTKDGAFINGGDVLHWTYISLPDLLSALRLLNERDAELGLYDLHDETLYLKTSGIFKKDFDFGEPKISKSTDDEFESIVQQKQAPREMRTNVTKAKTNSPESQEALPVSKQKTSENTSKFEVRCPNCREMNFLSERQIRQKMIFHPICKICLKELPLEDD